jgi:hypothetical protein
VRAIRKHINGVVQNPFKYIIDETGKVVEFENKNDAIKRLKLSTFTDSEIKDMIFINTNLHIALQCIECGNIDVYPICSSDGHRCKKCNGATLPEGNA